MVPSTEKRVNLRDFGAVRSFLLGDFRSFQRGAGGVTYGGIRPYIPGDRTKDINHQISEKLGDLHVNVRFPDRELEVVFIPDLSRSMHFGSVRYTKFEAMLIMLQEMLSVLHDERALFSLAMPGEKGELDIRLLGKVEHVAKEYLRDLIPEMRKAHAYSSASDMGKTLAALHERRLGGTVYAVVLSDFLATPAYDAALEQLVSGQHRVVGIALEDPLEIRGVPLKCGALRVRDLESGESGSVRTVDEHLLRHRRTFLRNNCPFWSVALSEGEVQ